MSGKSKDKTFNNTEILEKNNNFLKDGSGVNNKDEEDLGNGPEIPKTLEFESDKLSRTREQVHGEKYKQEPEVNTGSGKAIRHIVESGEEKHKKVKTLTTIAMEAGRKSGTGNNIVPEFEKEKELDKRKAKEIDKEGKTEDKEGNTDEDKEVKTDEDKEGKTDEDKEGKTDEDKEGKTDEDKEGKTDENKEGKTEDKEGKTDEDKEGKTDEDKEGKTDEDKEGKKAENENDNDSVKENEEPNRQKEELKGI